MAGPGAHWSASINIPKSGCRKCTSRMPRKETIRVDDWKKPPSISVSKPCLILSAVSYRGHSEVVQLNTFASTATSPAGRQATYLLCSPESWPCCTNSKAADNTSKFVNDVLHALPPGTFINLQHKRNEPLKTDQQKPCRPCKIVTTEFLDELERKALVDDTDDGTDALAANKLVQASPGVARPRRIRGGEEKAKEFLTKIQSGIASMRERKKIEVEAIEPELWNIRNGSGDYEHKLDALSREMLGLARRSQPLFWIANNVALSTTAIKRARRDSPRGKDVDVGHEDIYKDQWEQSRVDSALLLNVVVNKLVPCYGIYALAILSILAVSNYRYYDLVRMNGEQQDIFVALVVEGLLAMEIRIPNWPWFNPTVLIAWLLGDDVSIICTYLKLENLASPGIKVHDLEEISFHSTPLHIWRLLDGKIRPAKGRVLPVEEAGQAFLLMRPRENAGQDSVRPEKRKRPAEANGFGGPISDPPKRHNGQPHAVREGVPGSGTPSSVAGGGCDRSVGYQSGDSGEGDDDSDQSADTEPPRQNSNDAAPPLVAVQGHANTLQARCSVERQHTRTETGDDSEQGPRSSFETSGILPSGASDECPAAELAMADRPANTNNFRAINTSPNRSSNAHLNTALRLFSERGNPSVMLTAAAADAYKPMQELAQASKNGGTGQDERPRSQHFSGYDLDTELWERDWMLTTGNFPPEGTISGDLDGFFFKE